MSTDSKRASARKTYRTEWVDRWSPPKPLVGLQAIEKVLNRHTFLVCPESRLVVAVLARAIHDSLRWQRIVLTMGEQLHKVSKIANIQRMNWTVSYFNERVQREIAEWPVGIYADYLRLILLVEEHGADLRLPHSRARS